VVLAVPAVAGAASTRTCTLTGREAQRLGPTYVATVTGRPTYKVRNVSCATGKSVIKAFHACRLKKGKEGHCTTRVLGYRCTETRPSSLRSPISFEGDVKCTSGTKLVSHHYQQNI
jgi:hypothetical protein